MLARREAGELPGDADALGGVAEREGAELLPGGVLDPGGDVRRGGIGGWAVLHGAGLALIAGISPSWIAGEQREASKKSD